MKIVPRDDYRACLGHFCTQAGLGGGGGAPFFKGGTFQRGSGNLFSRFRQTVIPYVTPYFKKAGRYLFSKGSDFFSDLAGGKNYREAGKDRLQEIKKDAIDTVFNRQGGSGRGRKRSFGMLAPFPFPQTTRRRRRRSTRKKTAAGGAKRRKVNRRKKKTKQDIFG